MKFLLEPAHTSDGRISMIKSAALSAALLSSLAFFATVQAETPRSIWADAQTRALANVVPMPAPNRQGAGMLQLFPDLNSFQSATTAMTLNFEDFSARPSSDAAPCYEPINSDMGQPGTSFRALVCFQPQQVVPGFNVRSDLGTGPGNLFYFGGQSNPVGVNLVGAATGPAQVTYIDFDDGPIAVAMDVADWMGGSSLDMIVYDASGRVLGDIELIQPSPTVAAFAGFISPVPVQRVEIRSLSGASQMFGNLRFGGQAGGYTPATTRVSFGPVAVADNAEIEVDLVQTGDLPVEMPELPVPSPPFAVVADTCSEQVLSVGASCSLRYAYGPGLERADRSRLEFPATFGNDPIELSLRGRGVAPTLGRDRDVLSFGEVAVGDSASAGVSLHNPVAVPLQVLAIDAPQAPFQVEAVSGACPATPFELAPGQSCQLGYRLQPTADGDHVGRILIDSDDPSSPWRLLLRGVTGDVIFANGFD